MNKRKRDDYLKSDAGALKEELKDQFLEAERKKIHIILSTDQKKRVLEIEETFGPSQTEIMTGISEKNILRWKAAGSENLNRKKGSGRRIQHPDFEAKLIEYFKDVRKNAIGLSTKKICAICSHGS